MAPYGSINTNSAGNRGFDTKSSQHSASYGSTYLQSASHTASNGGDFGYLQRNRIDARYFGSINDPPSSPDEEIRIPVQTYRRLNHRITELERELHYTYQRIAELELINKQGGQSGVLRNTEDTTGGAKMNERSLMTIPLEEQSKPDKASQLESYKKQLEFIKTGLDLSDRGLSRKKVKDLPELLQKAQNEMTIGKLDSLLKKEDVSMGLVERVLFQANKWLSRKKRRY